MGKSLQFTDSYLILIFQMEIIKNKNNCWHTSCVVTNIHNGVKDFLSKTVHYNIYRITESCNQATKEVLASILYIF